MSRRRESRPGTVTYVDGVRLWVGGVATAVVAALVAVVGLMLVRGVLGIDAMAPAGSGTWDTLTYASFATAAAVGALVATALLHVLLALAPNPLQLFGWLMTLAAIVGAAWPFVLDAPLREQVATAAIDVVVVASIFSLLTGAATRSLVDRRPVT